ncbi:MAG: 50S ribosomal protein L22 [Deltaproteobacteria bacterium]|nr:50S ribosomal protein L22 [Deltaproteobacteria bacterium]
MQVQATAKYMRISPRKVRRVADVVKGKPVEAGLNTLKFMPQKAAAMVSKVIQSALANAESQTNMDVDSLVIKNIYADQGPTLKRWRPRAQGRVGRILKRTSHITVVLDERS